MGTPLSEVYDLFMQLITDYRLVELFNISEQDFEVYLEPWLMYSIFDFNICNQSLEYDEELKEFDLVLARENKLILANLMVKYWATKNVNDITQMNLHVVDRDFKLFSESQNLREKTAQLDKIRETCSQMLIDYGYRKIDWSNWTNQNFMG